MRLLFLTSRLPYPPDRGDRLRVYNFIRSLSCDHDISLISFIADESEREQIKPLMAFCQAVRVVKMSPLHSASTVGLNLWRKQPLQTLYYRSKAMQTLVDGILSEVDFNAVYVHLFRMAPYVEGKKDLYRIVDLTDMISQELNHSMPYRGPISRLLYSIERPRIEYYEQQVAIHFNETWLISKHDRAVLAERCPDANIKVIRNGVDTKTFHPTGEPIVPNSLIFVGHMGVYHNVDAAIFLVNEILPLVRYKIPEVTLKIVGASPISQIQKLSEVQGVEVTGYIPDLNAILNQSSVFVAPLRFAAGVQNKVLEAMAAGRPVVTTSLVSLGLGAHTGRELLVSDDASSIANAVISLLQDDEKCQTLGRAAQAFIQANYNWDIVRERVGTIQKSIC